MCWSLLNKFARVKAFNVIKTRLKHTCFLVSFVKILKTPILYNTYFDSDIYQGYW